MDGKLRNFEDMIVNEALKYTGAHEGITDAKEIQDVKDKVMANLATAYSLEKMRQALRDFKSSLLAQKMSRYIIILENITKKFVYIFNLTKFQIYNCNTRLLKYPTATHSSWR